MRFLLMQKIKGSLLNKYFKQFKPAEDSAFVDFGGGGTALIRLNQLLLDNQDLKLGLLFYRHPQSYKHSVEHHLFSFLPLNRKTENALNIISRTPDILEILLNASFSTTINYESLVNGSVMPSKNNPKTNELNNSKIFGSFQQGVDAFFKTAKILKLDSNTFCKNYLANSPQE